LIWKKLGEKGSGAGVEKNPKKDKKS